MIDRRRFTQFAALVAASPAFARSPAPLDLATAVRTAEKACGGRVGLCVDDTATGRRFSHRGTELFPMASTFKMLLAAAVLQRVDTGRERLARAVPIRAADIVSNSPVSEQHVGGTASVAALCEAMVIYSDNSAANLLLPTLGGPAGFTAWLRRIGDPVTRLDRYETMMSEALPGDPRDTTSPDAVAAIWKRVLLGPVLAAASRDLLTRWLIANTTGDTRLRAGLPKGWTVGDKTGTGGHGSVNDIAIVWPKRAARGPVIIASFVNGGTAPPDVLFKAHAELAHAIAMAL